MTRVSPGELLPGVTCLEDLVGQQHNGVFGFTGTGKSFLTKRLHARNNLDVSVFVNWEEEKVAGVQARTPSEVRLLISRGHSKIHWCPPKGDEKATEAAMRKLRDELYKIGDNLRKVKDPARPWCLVIADECHWYAPNITGKRWALNDIMTTGRKRGIHVLAASQRLANVHNDVVGQCKALMVFDMKPVDEEALRRLKYPVDEWASWTEQEHHFAVTTGRKWTAFEPL